MHPSIKSSTMTQQPETYTPLQVLAPIVVNWFCCVTVVLVNKFALKEWKFGTTLTALHFTTTFTALAIMCYMGAFQFKKLSIAKVIPLSISFCASIVLNNLSIQFNSVWC